MAQRQTTTTHVEDMSRGSIKLEVAPYVSDPATGVWVEAGLGDSFAFTEEITKMESEADNGEMPDTYMGVATQKGVLTGNVYALNRPFWDTLRQGLDETVANADGSETTYTGGGSGGKFFMVRATNVFTDIATTADIAKYGGVGGTLEGASAGDNIVRKTIYILYKCSMDTGLSLTWTSDEATDPKHLYPISLSAKQDTSKAVLRQLMQTDRTVIPLA